MVATGALCGAGDLAGQHPENGCTSRPDFERRLSNMGPARRSQPAGAGRASLPEVRVPRLCMPSRGPGRSDLTPSPVRRTAGLSESNRYLGKPRLDGRWPPWNNHLCAWYMTPKPCWDTDRRLRVRGWLLRGCVRTTHFGVPSSGEARAAPHASRPTLGLSQSRHAGWQSPEVVFEYTGIPDCSLRHSGPSQRQDSAG